MSRPPENLPRFLIIGAVKAATTWIKAQLAANPGVFIPGPEPHYFSSAFAQGPEWYGEWFADAPPGAIPGEKSADYLAHPLAPSRIRAALPHVPLVVQLRNPVERAYSDYRMLYRRGTVTGPPERYLLSADGEQPRFLLDGLYGRHLSRWLDHFPREQLLVLLFEDVRANPRETVTAVCRHIGAPDHFTEAAAERRINDGAAPLLPLPLRRALAPLKDTVAPLRGSRWFEALRGTMAREVPYPPLTDALRDRLTDFYADDVARLARLTGRNLDAWLAPRRETAA